MNLKRKKIFLKLANRLIVVFTLFTLHFSLYTFPKAKAHTYHTSLTRMDYDAKEKNIEISIQLFVHDVTPLLEKRLKKQVDLGKTTEVDGELFKYLQENFVFQNKNGETQKLKWVGKEFESDTIYIYVEIPFAEDLTGVKLQNTLFFESFAEQTNLVIAHFGEKKSDLLFKGGDKFKDL